MKRLTILMVFGMLVGGRPASAQQPDSAIHISGCPSVPIALNSFQLVKQKRFEDPSLGASYRYTDGSPDRVTVFVYPATRSAAEHSDDQARVDAEGGKFLASLPVGVQRGWYDAYTVAFAGPQPIELEGGTVAGFSAGVPTRKDDAITVEVEYVYLINGCFVKARGSLSGDTWMESPFPKFAKDLGAAAATQGEGQ